MNYVFNIFNFDKRKVTINDICDVILIPSRNDIENIGLKYDIWYSLDELNLMHINYMIELNIISKLKNVTLKEAKKIWKQNN